MNYKVLYIDDTFDDELTKRLRTGVIKLHTYQFINSEKLLLRIFENFDYDLILLDENLFDVTNPLKGSVYYEIIRKIVPIKTQISLISNLEENDLNNIANNIIAKTKIDMGYVREIIEEHTTVLDTINEYILDDTKETKFMVEKVMDTQASIDAFNLDLESSKQVNELNEKLFNLIDMIGRLNEE